MATQQRERIDRSQPEGHPRQAGTGGWPLAILLLAFFLPSLVQAQTWTWQAVPLRQVISDIETRTPYRFLYRDALITHTRVTLAVGQATLLAALDQALRPDGLRLLIDEPRKQVLIAPTPAATPAQTTLQGTVLDAETGGRLPFATLSWRDQDQLRGVVTNEAGVFRLVLPSPLPPRIDLTVSYLGYRPRTVQLEAAALPGDLSIRLVPDPIAGQEVVVSSLVLHTDLDTTWHRLLQPGLLAPLGESNVIRSLQMLPSVATTEAFSEGFNVRGSRADGFQVLLDGVPIYNQSHFFGLFDAFNEEALQAVGFFYNVVPASYAAPPGGTLSFLTRTGSQTATHAHGGLSNTSAKATLEGPLAEGRGSWLLSGRHSYLNTVSWFNNDALIAQGLDAGRETSLAPPLTVRRFPDSAARFYDLHGKLYRETARRGARQTLNVYLGGDATDLRTERFLPLNTPGDTLRLFVRREVETVNDWGNEAVSLHDQRPLGARTYSHTWAATSHYYSRYHRDDFAYFRPPATGRPAAPEDRTFFAPFTHDNSLREWLLHQQLDRVSGNGTLWTGGYTLHYFDLDYRESSALRPAYREARRSAQADAFASFTWHPGPSTQVEAGLRTHYFTQGRFFRLSPRLQGRLWPQRRLSFGAGYSLNHQFLHRLYLEHDTSSDVWVMSRAEEPPTQAPHLSAGVYAKLHPTLFVQLEAYVKRTRNLRLHQTTVARREAPLDRFTTDPWLHDSEATARGIEAMARRRFGAWVWTGSYAWARTLVQHPALNDGQPFRADWDRRHQFTTHLQGSFGKHLAGHLTWLYASGSPNTLAYTDPREPETLPAYHRLDAGVQYHQAVGRFRVDLQASVFNLYDRQNTWYRAPFVAGTNGAPPTRGSLVNVDVYDLGFQPSFELAVSF